MQLKHTIALIFSSYALTIFFLVGMYWLIRKAFKERSRIRNKLNVSESKFSSAFNNSAAGMAIVSLEGEWLEVNNYLIKLLGYSREELSNMTFQSITHPDDLEANLNLLKQVVDRRLTKYQLEKRFIHKDGYPVWALVNVSLVNDLEGMAPFFVSQIIDISASKNLIGEIEKKNDMLTRTTDELKIKIGQLEDFNYIVAHNLRGPAGTIQYVLSLIEEEESEDEKQTYMKILAETSRALNETLDELMNILELKLNDQIRFDLCDLNQVAEKVRMELGGEIIRTAATITTNFEIDAVSFPRVYLESIFYNMISNSLKYRRTGVPLVINISSFMNQGKTAIIFEDNGLGIDLDRHGNDIFKLNKVFHSGHNSKGFGLFITKSQVVSRGGEIQVESKPNEGTRFTVSL